jgi:hypothetical protein
MAETCEPTVGPLDDAVDHVRGPAGLFIDGVVHLGPYDASSLLKALTRRA